MKRVLDLGCGEGKNAAAFAHAGAQVTAVDCSKIAIFNGKRKFSGLGISWVVGDAIDFAPANKSFDVVIMYGILHCLPSFQKVETLIDRAIASTKVEGWNLLVAFNDRSQDLVRAHPDFHPTLLAHGAYMNAYLGHQVIYASDTILYETHPHNNIKHHHSLTRMIVKIK